MAGGWISKATSKNRGAFRRQAARAGKSTAAYAKEVLKAGSKASTTTKRRAALAQTLRKMAKKRR